MNGAQLIVMVSARGAGGVSGAGAGDEGAFHACDTDAAHFYSTMLKDFMAMVAQGEQTFDLLKALEVFQIAVPKKNRCGRADPFAWGKQAHN